MGNQVIRYSERAELWDAITALSGEVWPEYNLHGDVLGGYWDRLYDEFAEFQFVLYDDEAHEVIAEGHTSRAIGTARRRPRGWDRLDDRGRLRRSRGTSRRRPRWARSRRRSGRASKAAGWPTGCSTRWPISPVTPT